MLKKERITIISVLNFLGIVVDTAQALKFAIDICRGMAFLHTLDPLIPRFYLSSKHVMVRLKI